MERRIVLTWTCSEQIDINIPDGTITRDQVKQLITEKADYIMPGGKYGPDEWGYEWEHDAEPKYKGESDTPPDDFWFEVRGLTIAHTGYELITKKCAVKFQPSCDWREPKETNPIGNFLDLEYIKTLPLTTQWFHDRYRPFLGCKIVGNPKQLTYALDSEGELIAAFLPAHGRGGELFQFYPTPYSPDADE